MECIKCERGYKFLALTFGLSLFAMMGLNDTLWSPFLPMEFTQQGISESTVGLIVASYDVISLFASIFAMLVKNVHHRPFTFCLASCSMGILSIIFGQLIFISSGLLFIVLCVVTRALMGFSTTMLWCSGSSLFISLFPDNAGKLCSAISTALSIGMILGAPFGSLFYGIGGYQLPFWLAGCLQLVLSVTTFCILRRESYDLDDNFDVDYADYDESKPMNELEFSINQNLSPKNEKVTVFQFLTNAGVVCLSVAATATASSVGFFLVSFGQLLFDQFEIPSESAGRYFLPFTLVRAISAPIFGLITDRGFGGLSFSIFGCALSTAGLSILGISGIFHILNNLPCVVVLMTIIGISSTGAFVPYIAILRKIYKQKKYVNMDLIDSYTSAMYCACFGTGMVIGQSVTGGFVFQYLGFYYSCLVQAAICATTGSIGSFYLIQNNLLLQ